VCAETDLALAPLPDKYTPLLARAVAVLSRDPRVRAVWLAGSVGSRTADRASDLDLIVTVGAQDVASFGSDWPAVCAKINDTVIMRCVLRDVVWTMVTPDWVRWDVVVEPSDRLASPVPSPRLAVWDPGGMGASLRVAERGAGPSRETVRALIEEWFRATAMPETITVRNDWLLAVEHVFYLRGLTYRMCVESQKPMPPSGVKRWASKLSPAQQAAFLALPASALSLPALIDAHLAISKVFLATAEELADRLDLVWPRRLEEAATRHLQAEWRIAEPYPRH
jgi:hypothetical protein